MDLESRKYNIIQELFKVKEESVIYTLEQVLKKEKIDSIDIPEDLKKILDKGLTQIEEGKTHSTEEVMSRVKDKFNLV
jgi:predicted transcriptional regulator